MAKFRPDRKTEDGLEARRRGAQVSPASRAGPQNHLAMIFPVPPPLAFQELGETKSRGRTQGPNVHRRGRVRGERWTVK